MSNKLHILNILCFVVTEIKVSFTLLVIKFIIVECNCHNINLYLRVLCPLRIFACEQCQITKLHIAISKLHNLQNKNVI